MSAPLAVRPPLIPRIAWLGVNKLSPAKALIQYKNGSSVYRVAIQNFGSLWYPWNVVSSQFVKWNQHFPPLDWCPLRGPFQVFVGIVWVFLLSCGSQMHPLFLHSQYPNLFSPTCHCLPELFRNPNVVRKKICCDCDHVKVQCSSTTTITFYC